MIHDLLVVTFGEQLRHYRERDGLTQEELAAQAGLTEKAIGALERGERRTPYPRTVQALLRALQLTDDERASLLLAWSAAKEQQRAAAAQSAPRKQPPGEQRPVPAAPIAAPPVAAPNLLATRVLPPPPRAMAVLRPRLLQRLQLAPASGVTIVVAPAGFGKTTLLTAWIARLPDEQAARVAWLALEVEDADSVRLLRYLITALQRVAPQIGQSALALLETQQPPQAIAVLTLLINDLAQLAQPLTLILDDYHLLRGSANQQMLRFLVDHLPPQLRLVIASREDPPLPLTQLRARGQLAELRATDLRFTTDEAAAFLTDAMGLALDSQAILALEQRTEGWAAGLQLAALALRDRADQADFLRSFAGSHRLVLDYLAEEVLDHLPRHMQTFLLQTSVLDRLCGPLCDAVLLGSAEHQDAPPSDQEPRSTMLGSSAYSQLILEEIERANLFLVPLDDLRGWYRYHHLFGEVLRARLLHGASPATIRLLHGRAAAWYAAQGLWHEAIPHALAARQWALAAQAITAIGDELLLQNATDTLRRLIEAVPEPERDLYPALLLLQGLSAARDYDLRRAAGYLQRAAAAFAAVGDHTGRGAALLHLSDCQRSVGEFEAAHVSLQQALTTPLPPRQRLNALISRAYEAVATGDGPQAITALEEALTLTGASDDRWLRFELAINAHSLLLILPGGIDWAERLSRVAQSWPTPPISPLRAALAWISGFSGLLRGDLARAAAQIAQAMDIGEQLGGINKLSIDAGLYHAVTMALRGDLDGADQRFIALRTLLDQAALAAFTQSWGALHHYCVGWLRWRQGRLDEARAIVREMDATASPAEWPTAPCARLLLRGLLTSAEGDTQQAETLLLAALAEQQRFADALMLGDARMLLGYNALRANRSEAALAFVSAALDAHIQRGTPGVLLIQGAPVAVPLLQLACAHQVHSAVADRLLRALDQSGTPASIAAPAVNTNPDMLTLREQEVLRLLARGASNKTIADALVISLHTTKTHVAHILDKLGAASRSEAVAQARDLGLI